MYFANAQVDKKQMSPYLYTVSPLLQLVCGWHFPLFFVWGEDKYERRHSWMGFQIQRSLTCCKMPTWCLPTVLQKYSSFCFALSVLDDNRYCLRQGVKKSSWCFACFFANISSKNPDEWTSPVVIPRSDDQKDDQKGLFRMFSWICVAVAQVTEARQQGMCRDRFSVVMATAREAALFYWLNERHGN